MSQQPDTVPAYPAGPPPTARTGSPDQWRTARLALLYREKQINRLRDDGGARGRSGGLAARPDADEWDQGYPRAMRAGDLHHRRLPAPAQVRPYLGQ